MKTSTLVAGVLWAVLLLHSVAGAFTVGNSPLHQKPPCYLANGEADDDEKPTNVSPLTKASWYAVEAFGKVFGGGEQAATSSDELDLSSSPTSLEETIKRIQLDNDRSYFLTGQVDKLIYDTDCEFADPFVSFRGRDRFVENLANLGSFITKYSAKMLDYTQDDCGVRTKVTE